MSVGRRPTRPSWCAAPWRWSWRSSRPDRRRVPPPADPWARSSIRRSISAIRLLSSTASASNSPIAVVIKFPHPAYSSHAPAYARGLSFSQRAGVRQVCGGCAQPPPRCAGSTAPRSGQRSPIWVDWSSAAPLPAPGRPSTRRIREYRAAVERRRRRPSTAACRRRPRPGSCRAQDDNSRQARQSRAAAHFGGQFHSAPMSRQCGEGSAQSWRRWGQPCPKWVDERRGDCHFPRKTGEGSYPEGLQPTAFAWMVRSPSSTGSGRNIGRSIVESLAALGAKVVVNGHSDKLRSRRWRTG